MSYDSNGHFFGTQYGRDRMGFTTPDPDACDILQPFLPISYPAPWLPKKRRDDAHPAGANKVISIGHAIGLDKNGCLIPAGYLSGSQAASGATTDISGYSLVKYDSDDVGFAFNPKTGLKVAAAGEYVLLSAPSDAVAGTVVDGVAITENDIAFALRCDLIPGGRARAIGYAMKDMYQYTGGVVTPASVNPYSFDYTLDSMNPTKYTVTNYMHEPGQAIRTKYVLRMPWIGATSDTLQGLVDPTATNWVYGDFNRSFVHFVGARGNANGNLFPGALVVPAVGGKETGNYAPFDSTKHDISNVVGKVLGIESTYPNGKTLDYADRVRSQFERAAEQKGPFREQNYITHQMGGSATRGMDTMISITTNGAFRYALDNGLTIHPEFHTYVYIKVEC